VAEFPRCIARHDFAAKHRLILISMAKRLHSDKRMPIRARLGALAWLVGCCALCAMDIGDDWRFGVVFSALFARTRRIFVFLAGFRAAILMSMGRANSMSAERKCFRFWVGWGATGSGGVHLRRVKGLVLERETRLANTVALMCLPQLEAAC
jgi:hypothetical protein